MLKQNRFESLAVHPPRKYLIFPCGIESDMTNGVDNRVDGRRSREGFYQHGLFDGIFDSGMIASITSYVTSYGNFREDSWGDKM